MIEDLPAPVCPTIPIFYPYFIIKLTFLSVNGKSFR